MMKKGAPTCRIIETHEERITNVLRKLPTDDEILELSLFLEAFSDFSRLKILLALANEELCTCDLSAIVGISNSAISHQLRILKDKRLVKYKKEGRNVFYSLDDEHVKTLLLTALEHVRERRNEDL